MGTEDQILKATKLITNTKKQRLKIQSRGQSLKNTILKVQNKISHKNYIYIYTHTKFALKTGSLFARQVIKMKMKGVIKNLKLKIKKK